MPSDKAFFDLNLEPKTRLATFQRIGGMLPKPRDGAMSEVSEAESSGQKLFLDIEDDVYEAVDAGTAKPEEDNAKFTTFQKCLTDITGSTSNSTVRLLFEQYDGDLDRAINSYYDGSYKSYKGGNPAKRLKIGESSSSMVSTERSLYSSPEKTSPPSSPPQKSAEGSSKGKESSRGSNVTPTTRYVGSIQVEAWITRPTPSSILSYGTRLVVSTPAVSQANAHKLSRHSESSLLRLAVQDDKSKGKLREIGRVPEDLARTLVPLIKLSIFRFEASCIFADSHLSVGDSFYIQIDCFILPSAYSSPSLYSADSLASTLRRGGRLGSESSNGARKAVEFDKKGSIQFSLNQTMETSTEKMTRERQVAIAQLFKKLGLTPVQSKTSKKNLGGLFGSNIVDDIITATTLEDTGSVGNEKPAEGEGVPDTDLDVNVISKLYKTATSEIPTEGLELTTPPAGFKLDLRKYQKQGLTWLLEREKSGTAEDKKTALHPLWQCFQWPKDDSFVKQQAQQNGKCSSNSVNSEPSDEDLFYVNFYSGQISLERPLMQTSTKGGILADEMGLGKTISTLSLVSCSPKDVDYVSESTGSTPVELMKNKYAFGTTLIVVPMSLLSQWQSEFHSSIGDGENSCMVYYGSSSLDLSDRLCRHGAPLVVLTTYGTILSEWKKFVSSGKPIGLYSVEFFRIVLDEAHTIRNRTSKTSNACFQLQARKKWCLTGTPIINRLDDLYSIIRFLNLDPWANFTYWKTFITVPFEQKKIESAMEVVQSIMDPILLRRTKNMKQADGTPLIVLPEKEVVIQRIELQPWEQELYSWYNNLANEAFRAGVESGNLLKKYTMIFTYILRLRQICCHYQLIRSGITDVLEDLQSGTQAGSAIEIGNRNDLGTAENTPISESPLSIYNDIVADVMTAEEVKTITSELYRKYSKGFGEEDCSICTNEIDISKDNTAVTECGHLFCLSCILQHIEYQEGQSNVALCPMCRSTILKTRIFRVRAQNLHTAFRTVANGDTPNGISDSQSVSSGKKANFTLTAYNPRKLSSKINALITHLRRLKDTSPGEQVVVFSSFTGFLDLIEQELLHEGGMNVSKFDGRMTQGLRKEVLESFKAGNKGDSRLTILLISLKAGGVGLNLTSASLAFMMDPWWSAGIEQQAIDRLHRMGQTKTVKVVRFIVQGSVEEKMLKIQERKQKIGEALGDSEEERRRRRIEEIQMLFES